MADPEEDPYDGLLKHYWSSNSWVRLIRIDLERLERAGSTEELQTFATSLRMILKQIEDQHAMNLVLMKAVLDRTPCERSRRSAIDSLGRILDDS